MALKENKMELKRYVRVKQGNCERILDTKTFELDNNFNSSEYKRYIKEFYNNENVEVIDMFLSNDIIATAGTILELAQVGDMIEVIYNEGKETRRYIEVISELIGYGYSKTFGGYGLKKTKNTWYFTYEDDVIEVNLWVKQGNDTFKRYAIEGE